MEEKEGKKERQLKLTCEKEDVRESSRLCSYRCGIFFFQCSTCTSKGAAQTKSAVQKAKCEAPQTVFLLELRRTQKRIL